MSPDVIASTIAAALSTVAVSNPADASNRAIAEGYEVLHSLLRAAYSHHREAIEALEQLEDRPWSEGRRLVLAEELGVVEVATEGEVISAVESLIDLLRNSPQRPGNPAGTQALLTGSSTSPKSRAM